MKQPIYTQKNMMLVCHSVLRSSRVIMPVIGVVDGMFITRAASCSEHDNSEFYTKHEADVLRERFDIHVGYKERAIIPREQFTLMLECDRSEATHIRFRRGKKALAHAETGWYPILTWNGRGELYIERNFPLGMNPFFSFDVLANRIDGITGAKHQASLLDIKHCNVEFFKPQTYNEGGIEQLITE